MKKYVAHQELESTLSKYPTIKNLKLTTKGALDILSEFKELENINYVSREACFASRMALLLLLEFWNNPEFDEHKTIKQALELINIALKKGEL